MAKIVLKTVQSKNCLGDILNGTYKPDFNKSMAACDEVFEEGYKLMLDLLSDKTGVDYEVGKDTCIWAWYRNPYFRNHVNFKNPGLDLVVITFEIDDSQVLFSDFDMWCDAIIEGSIEDFRHSISDVEIIDKDEAGICVQAICWGIPRYSILSVEPFLDYAKRELLEVV